MFRIKRSGEEEAATGIDMTPMIDMVFQLLIFFMLTSIIAARPVLDLVLPRADQAKPKEDKEEIHLFLRKGGEIFIDEAPVTRQDLPEVLKGRIEGGKTKTLFLSADGQVQFHHFVDLLDLAKGLGVPDLAIVTRSADGESE